MTFDIIFYHRILGFCTSSDLTLPISIIVVIIECNVAGFDVYERVKSSYRILFPSVLWSWGWLMGKHCRKLGALSLTHRHQKFYPFGEHNSCRRFVSGVKALRPHGHTYRQHVGTPTLTLAVEAD